MYFDLFKIPRVMLYILKITGKCLPGANFRRAFKPLTCPTYNIYMQKTWCKTWGPAGQSEML